MLTPRWFSQLIGSGTTQSCHIAREDSWVVLPEQDANPEEYQSPGYSTLHEISHQDTEAYAVTFNSLDYNVYETIDRVNLEKDDSITSFICNLKEQSLLSTVLNKQEPKLNLFEKIAKIFYPEDFKASDLTDERLNKIAFTLVFLQKDPSVILEYRELKLAITNVFMKICNEKLQKDFNKLILTASFQYDEGRRPHRTFNF